MKTRILWLTLVSMVVVLYGADVPRKADSTIQLSDLSTRIVALEQRVQTLERANVKLQQQVNELTKPRLAPLSK
jgi:hypothetical protein